MDFTGLAANVPCALQFRTTPPDINKEYLWSARVDHVFNDKDRGYIRVLRDNGFQPTLHQSVRSHLQRAKQPAADAGPGFRNARVRRRTR